MYPDCSLFYKKRVCRGVGNTQYRHDSVGPALNQRLADVSSFVDMDVDWIKFDVEHPTDPRCWSDVTFYL